MFFHGNKIKKAVEQGMGFALDNCRDIMYRYYVSDIWAEKYWDL